MTSVEKVLTIAKNELGYLEKKSNSKLNSKTENAGKNNYTKYSVPFGVNGCYWCCYFIMWVFYTACGNSKTKMKEMIFAITGACETLRQAFIKKKKYYTKGKIKPRPGYLIFFKGTRHAGANHIGIVYKVTDTKVYTYEGNTSGGNKVIDNGGGVVAKSYSLTSTYILGYGIPEYASASNESENSTSSSNNNSNTSVSSSTRINIKFPSRGYYKKGDGYKQNTSSTYKNYIKKIQKLVGLTGKEVDGEYGDVTVKYVKAWQKKNGFIGKDIDGEFGKKSATKAGWKCE